MRFYTCVRAENSHFCDSTPMSGLQTNLKNAFLRFYTYVRTVSAQHHSPSPQRAAHSHQPVCLIAQPQPTAPIRPASQPQPTAPNPFALFYTSHSPSPQLKAPRPTFLRNPDLTPPFCHKTSEYCWNLCPRLRNHYSFQPATQTLSAQHHARSLPAHNATPPPTTLSKI